jgi:hypothetical protein
MATNRRTNKNPLQSVADFLKKYWLVVVGVIFALPYIVKYMRSSQASVEANELAVLNADPVTQNQYLNQITTNTQIHQVAQDVYRYLGFAYSWYDPRSYYEQDEAAYLAITTVTVGGRVPLALIQSYSFISNGRNLQQDCIDALNENYYNLLHW